MLHTDKQTGVEILLIGNYAEYTKATALLNTSSSGYFIQLSCRILVNAEVHIYESAITIKYLDGHHHRHFENLQFA